MLDATEKVGGIFLITSDHGNVEDMVKRDPKTGQPLKDKNGNYQILTSHTCSPVRKKFLLFTSLEIISPNPLFCLSFVKW
jgi:bisphosphoglycerate-independent phosphoglycerate mutase (AlkP superfamily)